jgi:hypothetical protein
MLVKRAQQSDEQVLAWRGRIVLDDQEDQSGTDNTTDEELRLFLDRAIANLDHLPQAELDMCTQRAARCKFPAAPVNEEAILSEDYDAKKAEEEEKKNQTDSAEFSGGGELLTPKILAELLTGLPGAFQNGQSRHCSSPNECRELADLYLQSRTGALFLAQLSRST